MIDKISLAVAVFLASHDGTPDDRTAVYQVGTDVLISTVLTVAGVLGLATLLHNIVGGILYIVCFITVRSYTGGHHASTRLRCFILTCGIYVITALTAVIVVPEAFFCMVVVVFSLGNWVIWKYVPVENKNKRLPPDWKQRNRMKSWIIVIFWQITTFCISRISTALSIQLCMTQAEIILLILWCKPWEDLLCES